MAKDERVIRPMNGLGPVKGPGDKARAIVHTAKVAAKRAQANKPAAFKAGTTAGASKTTPPMSARTSAPKRLAVRVDRVGSATRQMASQRAPTGLSGAPNRAGASFTPGSKADMAYTGVKQGAAEAAPAVKKATTAAESAASHFPKHKLGSGPVGMAITAGAAAAGMAIHDKYRARKAKK